MSFARPAYFRSLITIHFPCSTPLRKRMGLKFGQIITFKCRYLFGKVLCISCLVPRCFSLTQNNMHGFLEMVQRKIPSRPAPPVSLSLPTWDKAGLSNLSHRVLHCVVNNTPCISTSYVALLCTLNFIPPFL